MIEFHNVFFQILDFSNQFIPPQDQISKYSSSFLKVQENQAKESPDLLPSSWCNWSTPRTFRGSILQQQKLNPTPLSNGIGDRRVIVEKVKDPPEKKRWGGAQVWSWTRIKGDEMTRAPRD